jgi:hypothetical protein
MTGNKDDLPAFHAGGQGVAGANSEFSPDRAGKDYLPLAGNACLHGKNILPHKRLGAARARRSGEPKLRSWHQAHPAVMVTIAQYARELSPINPAWIQVSLKVYYRIPERVKFRD